MNIVRYVWVGILLSIIASTSSASTLPPFLAGELITASKINAKFVELKNKLSTKFINISVITYTNNEPITAEKINQNITIIKNEGSTVELFDSGTPIKASDVNALFSNLHLFADNSVIYLEPASSANLNIYTLAGSRSDRVRVILNIKSGVTIYSSNEWVAALTTGSGWHADSKIDINNSGQILGMGGKGGNGQGSGVFNSWTPGIQGNKGGDAIELIFPIKLTNSGIIFAGGGGGSSSPSFHGSSVASCGGGGGGGQGYATSSGGALGSCVYARGQTAGGAGNINGPGGGGAQANSSGFISQAGGAGGTWGAAGNNSGSGIPGWGGSWGTGAPTAGGAAGNAIKRNGHSVNFVSGNTANQVKGPIN